jgi:hypothetical protein
MKRQGATSSYVRFESLQYRDSIYLRMEELREDWLLVSEGKGVTSFLCMTNWAANKLGIGAAGMAKQGKK